MKRIPSVEIRRVSCSVSIRIRFSVRPFITSVYMYSVPPCWVVLKTGEKLNKWGLLFGGQFCLPRTPLYRRTHFCFPIRLLQTECLQSKACSKYAVNLNNTCEIIPLQDAFVLCTPSYAALLHFVASEVEDIVTADCCDQLRPTLFFFCVVFTIPPRLWGLTRYFILN